MKVSVIIPTTGRESLIKAVASVKAQTYDNGSNLEIIIIPDGFPVSDSVNKISQINDPKRRFCFAYSASNHLESCNDSGATPRNKGIELATGEAIAYLDDDNEWLPNHLSNAIKVLEEGNDIAISNFKTFYQNKQISLQEARMKIGHIDSSSIVHTKKILEKIEKPYWNTKLYFHDFALVEALARAGAKIGYTKEATVNYNITKKLPQFLQEQIK